MGEYDDFAAMFADLYLDQGQRAAGRYALEYFGAKGAEEVSTNKALREAISAAFGERGFVVNYPEESIFYGEELHKGGQQGDDGAVIIPFPASKTIH